MTQKTVTLQTPDAPESAEALTLRVEAFIKEQLAANGFPVSWDRSARTPEVKVYVWREDIRVVILMRD